jgi:hypothetical protein
MIRRKKSDRHVCNFASLTPGFARVFLQQVGFASYAGQTTKKQPHLKAAVFL